ncbi:MAG: histidine kinase [Raoultibacter sp.]
MADIPKRIRYFALEIILFILALLSGSTLVWTIGTPGNLNVALVILAGAMFTLSLVLIIRLLMDPDNVRARQSDAILKLASETLACMQNGLAIEPAQETCQLLLPASSAVAVAITDKESILGYAGVEQNDNQGGSPIRTAATHATLGDGKTRIMFTPEEIGFPSSVRTIKAAIIVPLTVAGKPEGTLKFYFKTRRNINETQISVAEGFGELLSTQMAASALEQQTKLATSMELKALQSQINPHFLFNTINTIASLIRTDPEKARILLREFAVFYRRTLEDSSDLIVFTRELEQTQRYFTFEVARFGEDRLCLDIEVDPDVEDMMVPAFMVQPLVENTVRHAMPSEGMLSIKITGERNGDDVLVSVEDDGVGMTDEARDNILHPLSETGLGIAVKNINDRMQGYFGNESRMDIETELGRGTKVTLFLKNGAIHEYN